MDAGRTSFAPMPERGPSAGGWQGDRLGGASFGDPGGFGRQLGNAGFAPPAAAPPGSGGWVIVTGQFADPGGPPPPAAAPPSGGESLNPTPPSSASPVADGRGDRTHVTSVKPAAAADNGETGTSLAFLNPRFVAVNLEPPSPTVVALAGRLALGSAAADLVRPGDPVGPFAAALRAADGHGLSALTDVTRRDAQPPGQGPAAEATGSFDDTLIPLTPSADAVPTGDVRMDHAGLLPLDTGALGQGVATVLPAPRHPRPRGAGRIGLVAAGPWFVVVVGVGFGAAWVRRLPRKAAAPDPAEPLRRGLAWHWSDEFSTPVPLDAL